MPLPPLLHKHPPHAHQQTALDRMADKTAFALLMGPGTGKTKTLLDDAVRWYLARKTKRLVVVAPGGVHRQWIEQQLPEHLSPSVPIVRAEWYAAGRANRGWQTLAADRSPGWQVFAINSELLSHERGRTVLRDVLTGAPAYLAVDESQDFKTPGAKRTKALRLLGEQALVRRIASGTSITKGYEDWYAQFSFLDHRILGLRTFAGFKANYCQMADRGGYQKIVGYQRIDDLMERVAPYSYTLRTRDAIALPGETYMTQYVELTAEQRRVYDQLTDTFLLELSTGELKTEAQAAQRILRWQQLTGGFRPTGVEDAPAEPIPGGQPRLDAAVTLAQQSDGPCIIWARFRAELEALATALRDAGLRVSEYHGGRTREQRDAAYDEFTTGRTDVFLANPAVGSRGLNINIAALTIVYSTSYNYEHREQALARNYRLGQTRPVVVVDLVAPRTIDLAVYQSLTRKEAFALSVDSLKRYATDA